MSFRLKGEKAIGAQLSRLVASELRKSSDGVAGRALREHSVHDARKRVKKIRAVLHLLRKELGDDYQKLNERVRSAAHRLSAVRDADALLGMMKDLRQRFRDVITPAIAHTATATLKGRRRTAYARRAGRQLGIVRQTLVRSKRPLRSTIRDVASRRAMRDGVQRGYRRARRAMTKATAAQSEDAQFHEWRRRVKDHWYQLRLIEGVSRRARTNVHGRVRSLKRLQDCLGDDHNLVVLRGTILEQPHRFGKPEAIAAILGCVDQRQAVLRRRAVRRGRKLFSRKPSSFRKLISRSWP
jgi:CHAD domain-containing protein